MIEYNEDLKRKFEEVIKYSQNLTSVNIDELMDNWAINKEFFYKMFGNQYIKSLGEVQMSLSENAKDEMLNSFIEICRGKYEDLADFVEDQRDGFFNNVVVNEYEIENDVIPKGMKLLKAFKFFISDKEILNTLQSKASMLIQNNKIVGELCLSIHPLDFLSLSENTYNWRSCHALDGGYRAGNLSYIGDSTTIIAYIKGFKDDNLPNFPYDIVWNSKKWRMLLFISESHNFLMAGRQYPMDLGKDILNKLLNAYLVCVNKIDNEMGYNWSDWYNNQINTYAYDNNSPKFTLRSPAVVIRKKIYHLNDLVKDVPNSRHYNDLLYSSCYKPYYCWNEFAHTKPKFIVGSVCKCVACGQAIIDDDDSMLCPNCYKFYDEDNWC